MKLLKKEDGTIVEVQEISTPISSESIDARITSLQSALASIQTQLKDLEQTKKEFEKLKK